MHSSLYFLTSVHPHRKEFRRPVHIDATLTCNLAAMDFTLKPHPTIPKPDGPVLVCILDGWVGSRIRSLPRFAAPNFRSCQNATHCNYMHRKRSVDCCSPAGRERRGRVQRGACSRHPLHRCPEDRLYQMANNQGSRHGSWPALRCRHGKFRGEEGCVCCTRPAQICSGWGGQMGRAKDLLPSALGVFRCSATSRS